MARPASSIVLGPHGVTIKPIVDITKFTLALTTALGTMLVILEKNC